MNNLNRFRWQEENNLRSKRLVFMTAEAPASKAQEKVAPKASAEEEFRNAVRSRAERFKKTEKFKQLTPDEQKAFNDAHVQALKVEQQKDKEKIKQVVGRLLAKLERLSTGVEKSATEAAADKFWSGQGKKVAEEIIVERNKELKNVDSVTIRGRVETILREEINKNPENLKQSVMNRLSLYLAKDKTNYWKTLLANKDFSHEKDGTKVKVHFDASGNSSVTVEGTKQASEREQNPLLSSAKAKLLSAMQRWDQLPRADRARSGSLEGIVRESMKAFWDDKALSVEAKKAIIGKSVEQVAYKFSDNKDYKITCKVTFGEAGLMFSITDSPSVAKVDVIAPNVAPVVTVGEPLAKVDDSH